jgi:hypothetical protein
VGLRRQNVMEEKDMAGRPADYYKAREVAEIFQVGLATVYRKPEEWGGRWIAGCLRFPRIIVDNMRRKDGALEPK